MRKNTRRTHASPSDGLTLLSAFSGAGGLDLGLEAAGFTPVACIEHNATAVATLKRNRPDWPVSEPEDIEDALVRLTPNAVCLRRLQLDLLAGGPPCQPFSKAAQWAQSSRRGLDDPRGACVEAFVELADRFLPAVILIENVQGFAQGSQSALTFLERRLAEVNLKHKTKYALHWRVMNAADYGVPQRRRRAILVARRDGGSWSWPDPTHDHKPCRSWDAIGGLKPTNGGPPPGEWGELLQSIPEGWNYQWLTEKGKGRRLFGYRTKFWSFLLKLSKNQPSWTLSANPAQNAGPFHWDNRRLTAKEMARLQSFPASWRFEGDYAQQVKQIGNATPPLFAEVIGRAIGEQVFGVEYPSRPKLRIRRKRRVEKNRRTRPVAKKYLHLEGRHAAHPGTGRGPRPVKLSSDSRSRDR